MSVYFNEAEEIYFSKTKEYFQEVISSYSIGNYRSAIVMLYSVAICDMLLKLQELKDMYNDTVAEEILKEVDKSRNEHDSKSKSKWEKELIENIYKKTKLLDFEAYVNLNHLYDHRNFSAHPAMTENYELIAPSKETTVAHIKNILNSILIKPPIFIRNIISTLTDDLRDKKLLYEKEFEKLTTYLNNKYFSKMTTTMKLSVFRAFWKFCFSLPEDEECKSNMIINRKALKILFANNEYELLDYIKNNKNMFTVAQNDKCLLNLCIFLSTYPTIYKELNDDTCLQIDTYIMGETRAKAIAWFKYTNPQSHFDYLKSISFLSIDEKGLKRMTAHYSDIGELASLINFCIWYYGKSYNYDSADMRFELAIEPFLEKMFESHFEQIIKNTNDNRQIWDRGLAYSANNKIMRYAKKVLKKDFNYSLYRNFHFDEKILQLDDSSGIVENIENDID